MSAEVTREALADYAHSAWSGWMKYQFSKAELQPDGTWIMPAWAVERWQRQANTPYVELPEDEKASDRKEADEILVIVGKREHVAHHAGAMAERVRLRAKAQGHLDKCNENAETAPDGTDRLEWEENAYSWQRFITVMFDKE